MLFNVFLIMLALGVLLQTMKEMNGQKVGLGEQTMNLRQNSSFWYLKKTKIGDSNRKPQKHVFRVPK